MKHVVIAGHPNPGSFTLSAADAYRRAAEGLGHQVVMRDLYSADFDPRLHEAEIPRPGGFAPDEDVRTERALIGDADVYAFLYPLWFNMPPAIVTGYVQRVFGMGFGYGPMSGAGNVPLLRPRRMISFSSSGAPAEWLRSEGAWDALRTLFDEHVAEVCGLTLLDHRHYGRVLGSTPKVRIEAHLRDVQDTVQRHFKHKFEPEPT